MMMLATQPAHVERLAVVLVVHLGMAAADLAALSLELTTFQVNSGVGAGPVSEQCFA